MAQTLPTLPPFCSPTTEGPARIVTLGSPTERTWYRCQEALQGRNTDFAPSGAFCWYAFLWSLTLRMIIPDQRELEIFPGLLRLQDVPWIGLLGGGSPRGRYPQRLS